MNPLDIERLMLLCDGNRTEAHELLQMTIDSFRERLNDIEEALGAKDVATLKRAFHDVRGVAANVGATEVASLAEMFDDQIRGGGTSISDADLAELHLALERLETATREFAP